MFSKLRFIDNHERNSIYKNTYFVSIKTLDTPKFDKLYSSRYTIIGTGVKFINFFCSLRFDSSSKLGNNMTSLTQTFYCETI